MFLPSWSVSKNCQTNFKPSKRRIKKSSQNSSLPSGQQQKQLRKKSDHENNLKQQTNMEKTLNRFQTMKNNPNQNVVLYVMVVGFHHKKGCQIEYCYPPLPEKNVSNDVEHCHISTANIATTKICDNNDKESNKTVESLKNDKKDDDDDNPKMIIKLPDEWKSLPSLAIPDGAHNFERDTVFFHLPSLDDPERTVFGVACYQQILTKMLLVRTPDLTRSSVQKSVVAILSVPLYGLIEHKLRIITRSYFNELDFSKTSIMEEFHHSMSLQLKQPTLSSSTLSNNYDQEICQGLPLRLLFSTFGQQIILLFKLLLLEKKVMFIMSPIRDLSGQILALCSLFPGLLQQGMFSSHLPVSCHSKNHAIQSSSNQNVDDNSNDQLDCNKLIDSTKAIQTSETKIDELTKSVLNDDQQKSKKSSKTKNKSSLSKEMPKFYCSTISLYDDEDGEIDDKKGTKTKNSSDDVYDDNDDDDLLIVDDDILNMGSKFSSFPGSAASKNEQKIQVQQRCLQEILTRPYWHYGLPLTLFECNSYCLPYCSINCFECLNHVHTRCCLAGSSNQIFQRWQNDIDVFIVNNQIIIEDANLKRILTPTVEDLRFITFLLNGMLNPGIVGGPSGDNSSSDNSQLSNTTWFLPSDFLSGGSPSSTATPSSSSSSSGRYQPQMIDGDCTGPEYDYTSIIDEQLDQHQQPYKGSDAWCRFHFKNYLIHMLRCSLLDETSKEYRSFNGSFMSEWRMTYNYKCWQNIDGIVDQFEKEIDPWHPFTANRMNDIRFKITNFFNNRQDNLNSASKVVLNTAKTTLSSWMSSIGSYSSAGQQAKTLLTKTVKLANQLMIEGYENDEEQQQQQQTEHQKRMDTKVETKVQEERKMNDPRGEYGFNLDDSDYDHSVEEQETSV